MSVFTPPRHIVWSTDHLDLIDPFQRRWYLRQVLLHGRAEDILGLDLVELKQDFREFIQLLNDNQARYLVVGGYAVALHGYPRYTKDIDI